MVLLFQGSSVTKVPRLDMCRFIISLSKITHQMWRDHLFSQRNKAAKRVVEVEVLGVGQNLRMGDRQYRGTGVFIK